MLRERAKQLIAPDEVRIASLRRKNAAEELKRATALRQARETLKERLQSFLEVADSEPQRLRLRDCL